MNKKQIHKHQEDKQMQSTSNDSIFSLLTLNANISNDEL